MRTTSVSVEEQLWREWKKENKRKIENKENKRKGRERKGRHEMIPQEGARRGSSQSGEARSPCMTPKSREGDVMQSLPWTTCMNNDYNNARWIINNAIGPFASRGSVVQPRIISKDRRKEEGGAVSARVSFCTSMLFFSVYSVLCEYCVSCLCMCVCVVFVCVFVWSLYMCLCGL